LVVRGELDIAAAPLLRDRIAEAVAGGGTEIVCDMAGVNFVDSSGLSVLVSAHKRALAGAVRFVLANPQRQLLRLLDVSGTRDYLVVQCDPAVDETAVPATPPVA
jgi:anti-anti-sigma factor